MPVAVLYDSMIFELRLPQQGKLRENVDVMKSWSLTPADRNKVMWGWKYENDVDIIAGLLRLSVQPVWLLCGAEQPPGDDPHISRGQAWSGQQSLCQMLNIIAGDATSRSVRVTMCPAAQNFQSDQVTKIEVLGRQKYFHFHTTEMEPF